MGWHAHTPSLMLTTRPNRQTTHPIEPPGSAGGLTGRPVHPGRAVFFFFFFCYRPVYLFTKPAGSTVSQTCLLVLPRGLAGDE